MKALLFESELRVMNCLWERGDLQVMQLVPILAEQVGWNKNTTYTVVKKVVAKGYVERIDPGFVCHPLITRTDVEKAHTSDLVDRFYGGSRLMFLSAFVKNNELSPDEMRELKVLIDNWPREPDA